MEMTTYQAVFAVLLIFFLGDLVGALTKAKISSMFVIMMGFLVLFMTGIYPDNVMEISGFAGVASLGQYFLLFNMGTSVDIPTLKREWRTVLCATVGMAAAMMLLASILGDLCQGWVNMSIWCMVLGIICRNTGLVPSNLLRDYAKANGFFSFLSLCTIIPSLAKVDWAQLPVIGFKAVVIFVAVVIFTFIVFYLTPAWKIVGSKNLSIGIAMCQLIGYPGTELIATEITNAVAQTPEERDAISSKIQTAYVISGFTSVTILSVFIASFLAKLMGA